MQRSSQPRLPFLVGRERELAALRAQYAEASEGRGSLALISGEAGVGKTALADALCREAHAAGARILTGRCYDRTETPPYGPWLEAFETIHAVGRSDASTNPAIPRLADASSPEQFFALIQEFFGALTAGHTLVLVLDDLQWADIASLDVLRFLARGLATMRLLLVATYRPDELSRHDPLVAYIPLLVREAPVGRLDLRPLDAGAARALIDARYGLPAVEAERFAAYLIARTGGNALFLIELLRTLEDERLLRREDGRWLLGALAQALVPLLLKQVIQGRLARLGDEADALLAVAAVIGHEVPIAVWRGVAQADEEVLVTLVERAEAAHLVVSADSDHAFQFSHALIREVLYENVPTLRRRRLHRQVGEVLAALPAPDPDAVAYHLQRAGDEHAVVWLVRAAERAADARALATATERYAAAFTLLDARTGDVGERGWLRLLAAALCHHQAPERARIWVDEAVGLATEAVEASLIARAQALRGLLRIYRRELRHGIADLATAAAAIERLPPGTGVVRRREQQIDAIANSGTRIAALAYAGHLGEARALGETYLARSTAAAGDIGALADVHTGLSMLYPLQGEPALAQQSYAAGIAAYEAIGHHVLALSLRRTELALLVLPYRADDVALREQLVDAAERAARRLVVAGTLGEADPLYARFPFLVLEGRWREAGRLMESSTEWNLMKQGQHLNSILGPLARAQGNPERAWRCVREAWPVGPTVEPGDQFVPFAVPLLLLGVALALDNDDLTSARVWLDAHSRWMTWMGATLGRSEGHALEAAWHRAAGDAAHAREQAELALRAASAPRQPLALLAAHRLVGELATDIGRFGDAKSHLDTALALATACRAPYERALTLLAHAELALAVGDAAGATAALGEARAICEPLGAHPALARGEALTARLAAPPPRPNGLSTREVEVLRLVAAGLTNAQVAERLFISARTVNGHLTAIYTKLGVTGRAAAIRFAHDQGLV